jgi:glucose-6-phosphate 1-dehydrogenase
MPDAYERLLLDVMMGDASLFARADEVELAWGIVDPILQAWESRHLPKMAIHKKGVWGPEEAMHWMWRDHRNWLDSCPNLK